MSEDEQPQPPEATPSGVDDEIRRRIKSVVLSGERNVAIISSAGTGKSYLIKKIVKSAVNRRINIVACSTTGIGAIQIEGRTLHSWAGIELGEGSITDLMGTIIKRQAIRRWRSIQILVIDEISMLGATLLGKLDALARIIRKRDEPFGGIRLLVAGDFCQLPPVKDRYAFLCPEWRGLNFDIYMLTEPKRYTDISYVNMLSRIRMGEMLQEDHDFLRTKMMAYNEEEIERMSVKPTILYSLKINTNIYNQRKLDELETDEVSYFATDRGDRKLIPSFDNVIPKILSLKVGAQVMLRSNITVNLENLANGQRGVVTRLSKNFVDVEFRDGRVRRISRHKWKVKKDDVEIASRTQIPLILAWALTTHKSQGCTLDCAIVDIGPTIFAPFQAYVALSRVRNAESLYVSNYVEKAIFTDIDAVEYVSSLSSSLRDDDNDDNEEGEEDEGEQKKDSDECGEKK